MKTQSSSHRDLVGLIAFGYTRSRTRVSILRRVEICPAQSVDVSPMAVLVPCLVQWLAIIQRDTRNVQGKKCEYISKISRLSQPTESDTVKTYGSYGYLSMALMGIQVGLEVRWKNEEAGLLHHETTSCCCMWSIHECLHPMSLPCGSQTWLPETMESKPLR